MLSLLIIMIIQHQQIQSTNNNNNSVHLPILPITTLLLCSTTNMLSFVHPGSGVYMFTHILFYHIQYLTYRSVIVDQFDVLFYSIYGVDTDAVDYDDYLFNNNDIPSCISRVENNCSSTVRYGNNRGRVSLYCHMEYLCWSKSIMYLPLYYHVGF